MLPELIARRLMQSLPGPLAQRKMAPPHAYGRHRGPAFQHARPAAVALVVYPGAESTGAGSTGSGSLRPESTWRFPLTQRPDHLRDHGGQVSLPGGACDLGEDSLDCARREFREELGISEQVELQHLGQLSPLYIFATNFVVTPHVFASRHPLDFVPNPDEVAEVFSPGTDDLLAMDAVSSIRLRIGGADFEAPCWCLGKFRVWGATAMILSEWAEVLSTHR